MTPLTEDEIVERIYRAHGNSPTPQLRPVLRRIWAAGLSIVAADTELEPPTEKPWPPRQSAVTPATPQQIITDYLRHAPEQGDWHDDDHAEGLTSGITHALGEHGYGFVQVAIKPAGPGPDTAPERT